MSEGVDMMVMANIASGFIAIATGAIVMVVDCWEIAGHTTRW